MSHIPKKDDDTPEVKTEPEDVEDTMYPHILDPIGSEDGWYRAGLVTGSTIVFCIEAVTFDWQTGKVVFIGHDGKFYPWHSVVWVKKA